MLLGLNLQFRLWSEHLERRIYNRNRQIGWSQCQQVDHHLVGKRSLTLISMRLDHLLRPSNFFFFKLRKFVYKAVFGNLRRKKVKTDLDEGEECGVGMKFGHVVEVIQLRHTHIHGWDWDFKTAFSLDKGIYVFTVWEAVS